MICLSFGSKKPSKLINSLCDKIMALSKEQNNWIKKTWINALKTLAYTP